MAKIENVIADLITFVFNEKISNAWDELFEQMDGEDAETFEKRKEGSIVFMQSYAFAECSLETKDAENHVYIIKHTLSDAQILLSDRGATEGSILSSNFPELFTEMQKQYAHKSLYTLYDAFECLIRDVAFSPLMHSIKKRAIEAGYDASLWDKFVAHLIENKELCRSSQEELVHIFNQFESVHAMANPSLQTESEQAQIADYKGLIEEFKSLMHRLEDKIDELDHRQEPTDAKRINLFYNTLKEYWGELKEDKMTAEAFYNACSALTKDYESVLNRPRGGKWKQWAADWACWLLKGLTFGCIAMEYKTTTDTMQIALDITNQAGKVSNARDSFFRSIGTVPEIQAAMSIETKPSKICDNTEDDKVIELKLK